MTAGPAFARGHNHGQPVEDGEWFACDYPERPFDTDWTVFVEGCPACEVALWVAVALSDSRTCVDWRAGGDPAGNVAYSLTDLTT